MPLRCLICESKSVLPKEAANTAVLLIGTIDNCLLGVRQLHIQDSGIDSGIKHQSLLMQLLDLIGESVSSATSGYPAMAAFTRDVQRYQFGRYDHICLRCGAKFDQNAGT